MQCTGRILLKQRNDSANKSLLWTCFNNFFKISMDSQHIYTRFCQTWSECQHKDSTMACILQKKPVVFKERLNWPYQITRLTAHFYVWWLAWCRIWWFATFEKVCSYMTPNGLCGIIEQHKLNPHTHPNDCSVHIFRRGSTKWLYWQAKNGISMIAKWTAVHFSNLECNAYQVWRFWTTQAHFLKSNVIHQMFHLYLNWYNLKKKRWHDSCTFIGSLIRWKQYVMPCNTFFSDIWMLFCFLHNAVVHLDLTCAVHKI